MKALALRLLLIVFLGAWTLTFLRAIDHAIAVASWCGR